MRLSNKVASLDMKIVKMAPGVTLPDRKSYSRRARVGVKRYKIADAFREFMWRTVPTIEEKIEEKILRDLYHKMEHQELKDELIQAYKRRRLQIERAGFHEVLVKPADDQPRIIERPNIDVSFNDIKSTGEESHGSPC